VIQISDIQSTSYVYRFAVPENIACSNVYQYVASTILINSKSFLFIYFSSYIKSYGDVEKLWSSLKSVIWYMEMHFVCKFCDCIILIYYQRYNEGRNLVRYSI
jgi:hypothetical protein